MAKIKVRKDVFDEVKDKLGASKNVFARGDFDEYKFNMGVAPDGCVYDLDNPTEKFYYDLKRKFDETEKNTEIEKGMELRYVVPKSGKRKPYYQHFKCRDKLEYNPVLSSHNYTKEINEIFTEKDNNKLSVLKQNYLNKMKAARKSEDKKRYNAFVKIIDKKININNGKPDNITSYAIKDSNKIKTEFNNMIETEKSKLSAFEKKMIEKDIKNGSWVDVKTTKGNTIHLDFTKYFDTINDYPNKLKWELENASILADLGFSVYLVPELRDGSIDVIINNLRFELKHFAGSEHRAKNVAHDIYTTNPHGSLFIAKESKISDEKVRGIFDDKFTKTQNKKGILLTYSERNNDITIKKYSDIKKGLLFSNPTQHGFGLDLPLADYIVAYYTDLSSKKVIKSLTYSGYKLQGRTRLYGMDISIENKKGSYRSGVDKDGHKWKTLMHYDYGYIRGTVGTDKDHLDCVSPETKILMADYTEKCAADIKEGDELIGIKLETQQHKQRKQIKTKVIHVKKGMDDMLDITLENGVKLRTTKGHLHYKFNGNSRDKLWRRADELKIGDKLVMIYNHHNFDETEEYKKGYLYGAYTGDGCYNLDESKQVYCDIRKGVAFIEVIQRVKKYWTDLGLETVDIRIEKPRQTDSIMPDGRKIISKMDLAILSIRGINKIRFIKSIFVKNQNSFEWCRGYIAGLFDTDGCLNCRHEFQITQTKNQDEFMKFTIECINKLGYQAVKRDDNIKLYTDYMADNVTMEFTQIIKPALEKKRNFLGQTYRYEPLEIVDIKPYTGEFVAIQTDEQTYIANGLVTHNCYVGPDKEAQKVYVIHQNDPVTHKYDEDKCMLCFSSAADAKKAYMKQYDRPGFYGSMTTMTIDQFKSFIFSKKGKMIHKSFDIQITDITENNKQQKLEQFNKALNAIADKKPFMIKHIPADSSQRYENLTVRLMDFDRSKIEKAVHKVALSLDADISGASKGEAFVYKAQEEIVDKYFREFTNRTRAIYNFVISYFDLPDIRIVSKAGELRHKGKILYNPESGLPIKESDWKKFVVELEKYLNRNYTGIGEKIVLSSESLGIILDRLSKTNSLEAIRKMSLSQLKAKRYDVDWISESVKNMKDKFGEVISRERQARIQIAMDSAAQRVTRVKDDMRNNIQQIIIDGIRDKQSKSVVAQNLFDKCASLNRDMQRIADSEVQMASNSSYCKEEVYNSEPGSKVYFKRFEMIDDNTCKQCRKLNGTIVLWSDVPLPDEHIKDPYAKYAIWEGKNEGSCPIGIVHPYCRGTWVRYYPDLDKN